MSARRSTKARNSFSNVEYFLRKDYDKLGLEDELTQALYALQAEYPYIKLSELKRIYNTVCICRQIGEP